MVTVHSSWRVPPHFLPSLAGTLGIFGTYSSGWILIAVAGALVSGNPSFFWVAAGSLFEFIFTNGPVKAIFRRRRPLPHPHRDVPRWVPVPITSSFPSGHAAASAFNAILWVDICGWRGLPIAGLALLVASSRVYLRFHFFSDIIGGVVWGAFLALALLLIREAFS